MHRRAMRRFGVAVTVGVAAALGGLGCGGSAEVRPATAGADANPCGELTGHRSDARLGPGTWDLYGFRLTVTEADLDAPEGQAYRLEVIGPTSRRRITGVPHRPARGGALTDQRCGMHPAPSDPCEEIPIGVFATDLEDRVRDVGLRGGVYIDRVMVHDWAELDRAAVAVADALRAWRVADSFRVEVRPMECGNILEAT